MVYAVFMCLYLGTQLSRTLVGNPSRAVSTDVQLNAAH